jgi:hypothetical protein
MQYLNGQWIALLSSKYSKEGNYLLNILIKILLKALLYIFNAIQLYGIYNNASGYEMKITNCID